MPDDALFPTFFTREQLSSLDQRQFDELVQALVEKWKPKVAKK